MTDKQICEVAGWAGISLAVILVVCGTLLLTGVLAIGPNVKTAMIGLGLLDVLVGVVWAIFNDKLYDDSRDL